MGLYFKVSDRLLRCVDRKHLLIIKIYGYIYVETISILMNNYVYLRSLEVNECGLYIRMR